MIKSAYLAIPVVHDFAQWLARNLDNDTLAHRYINRRSGPWSCASLYDAYRQYRWPTAGGTTFADNVRALSALQTGLVNALSPQANDAAACDAAIAVMKWGGVSAGNVRWLLANEDGLARTLMDMRDALDADDTRLIPRPPLPLRFNAGMTKVYSLICQSLIIYDSRVAAALGWAVPLFCHERQLSTLPPELNFPWAPAKNAPGVANPKCRNPSTAALVFQKLTPGALHAEWNLKASWLLEAVLANAEGEFVALPAGERMRAMEAALFMIGYDLPMCAAANQPAAARQSTADLGDDWHECFTKKHNVPFDYRVTPHEIQILRGYRFSIAAINATLERLRAHFGHDPFPLANDVVKARLPDAPMGLGRAYHEATGRNPGETSKLAAVLEDLQLIQRAVVPGRSKLHWRFSDVLLALAAKGAIDITPWVDDFIEAQSEA